MMLKLIPINWKRSIRFQLDKEGLFINKLMKCKRKRQNNQTFNNQRCNNQRCNKLKKPKKNQKKLKNSWKNNFKLSSRKQ